VLGLSDGGTEGEVLGLSDGGTEGEVLGLSDRGTEGEELGLAEIVTDGLSLGASEGALACVKEFWCSGRLTYSIRMDVGSEISSSSPSGTSDGSGRPSGDVVGFAGSLCFGRDM
jgi:hypothetical protein